MNSKPPSIFGSFSEGIMNTSTDLSIDYTELTIDDILNEGILKEIPLVKSIVAIGKIAASVRELWTVKKLLTFLKKFHSQSIEEEKLTRFKSRFSEDLKYRNEVTEQLLVFNETFLYAKKSVILARLFATHISGHYDWAHFQMLSDCLNSMSLQAIPILQKMSERDFEISQDVEKKGLDFEEQSLLLTCGAAYETSAWSHGLKTSTLGKYLFIYGLS